MKGCLFILELAFKTTTNQLQNVVNYRNFIWRSLGSKTASENFSSLSPAGQKTLPKGLTENYTQAKEISSIIWPVSSVALTFNAYVVVYC